MHRFIRFAALLAVVAAWPLAQIAHAGPPEPGVPPAIAVPEGNKVFLSVRAVGVQIYSCNATAAGFGWSFVAPNAVLYGQNGHLLGIHFAGPTWQAMDGSVVRGQVVSRTTPYPTAIPWLLLSATSTAAGPGGDRLAATTYIQRIATAGGLAPSAASCNADTAGTTADVPYTAEYYFWKATGDGGS